MKLQSVLMPGIVFLAMATGSTQTISVDMDSGEEGIQEIVMANDTAETLTVAIQLSDAVDLYSYQCKIAFDTGSLSFLAAQQDFGLTGEKNMLTKNGGSVIGIFQLQTNPQAEDTIVISGSITGTDASLSVDGNGCIGVLYFASKVQPGDSATIMVTQGFLAAFGEDLTPVENYSDGVYSVDPAVAVSDHRDQTTPHRTPAQTRRLTLILPLTAPLDICIPAAGANTADIITVSLFSVDGKLLARHRQPFHSDTRIIQLPARGENYRYPSGTYLCTIRTGNYRLSRTVTTR